MKAGSFLKGAQVFGLIIAGAIFTGCTTTEPVREYRTDISEGCAVGTVEPVAEVIEPVGECVAPVGERLIIRSPGDRYFNPLTRSWERPYPYGPYDTANWR